MVNRTNSINAIASAQMLQYKPGGAPACFEVTVINESDQFAAFQLELKAEGADVDPDYRWYRLAPEVCAKKPPGDRTTYAIAIIDNPVPGFIGTINLIVRVFSLQLHQEERLLVRLVVAPGAAAIPIRLDLPVETFQVYPAEQVAIPVQVSNPSHLPVTLSLSCLGIAPTWLVNGAAQSLLLKPKSQVDAVFLCQPPAASQAPSQSYPFTIEAVQPNGPIARAQGTLAVLPSGSLTWRCEPTERQIPDDRGEADPPLPPDAAAYTLEFDNASNLAQTVSVTVDKHDRVNCTLQPEQADVPPGETAQLTLLATKRRPYLGLPQKLLLEVTAAVSDARVPLIDRDQTIVLKVKPIVPPWLQALGGLLLLLLVGFFLLQRAEGHRDAVTSVRVSGNGGTVLSAANDKTIRRWRVDRGQLQPAGILAQTDKAIRVIRYRPVDNNLVAAGLENGQIQLWQEVLGDRSQPAKTPFKSFFEQKADRVLSLAFTTDSHYLFSGHGSGLVLQWDVAKSLTSDAPSQQPVRQKTLDFAISDMTLVGNEQTLAIGGRYNRLVLWNWVRDQRYDLAYPTGDQYHYIFSVATAAYRPTLLATADSQGTIALWDLTQCLTQASRGCERRLDSWQTDSKPVRSLALSADGCYLASGGDNGRAMLWPLTAEGQRDPQATAGRDLGHSAHTINTVALTVGADVVRVVTGDDDKQVRLYRAQDLPASCR